jgi:glycosyltransferase involved in cell wall biosynthesis
MPNISGIILTKNNKRTIKESILSIIDLVDELIIIDDFSSDGTTEIIKNLSKKIIVKQKQLTRFDKQRNYGISIAKNKWILMIDSDEIVSKELSIAIKNLKTEENIDAYWVMRENQIFNKKTFEKYQNRPILFRKNLKFSYPVHETILINKIKLKQLNGHLIHKNFISFKNSVDKINHYSDLMADRWIEEKRNYGETTTLLFAILWPAYGFLQAFFGRKYYKMLLFGFVYAIFDSFWRLVGILKYYERKYRKS